MSTVPPAYPPPPGPPPATRQGCGKRVLIGCGVAALVVAAVCLAVILYIRAKPQVVTDFVMRQVESHYASDVTEQDKTELRAAYADFRQRLADHKVSREPLERMRATFMTSGSRSEVTHEQVRDMIRLFRESAGAGPPSTAPVELTPTAPVSPRTSP